MNRVYYSDFAFEAARQPKKQLPVPVVGVMATVGFNLVLIPHYGIVGAATAAVLSRTLTLLLSFWLARRLFPLPFPAANVAKIAACCGVMAAALWPTLALRGWESLIGQVLLGASAYVLAAAILNIAGVRQRLWGMFAGRVGRIAGRFSARGT